LAVEAAFEDPRLPRLRREDLDGLHIEVSLLSPRTAVPAGSRAELIEHLVPHETGLIISSGARRAVFLPSVWEQLPLPDDFIDHLLSKAGLPTDRWPGDMHAEVFTTESFGRCARSAAGGSVKRRRDR
jgi:AmmeMemoRadiSam system protein A